jgi:hypothetical protein
MKFWWSQPLGAGYVNMQMRDAITFAIGAPEAQRDPSDYSQERCAASPIPTNVVTSLLEQSCGHFWRV